ncbi:MAG: DUF4258 domain-containing protein [Deltaproteobacteria bacterium]|nr:DUF4258 domain-containing protein [Deltaproteobacteria bacterium]
MIATEALGEVRRQAGLGRVQFSGHARDRMRERGATKNDVVSALANGTSCKAAEGGKWKVTGPDIDGDDLTAVVAIEDDVVVVTVF